MNIGFADVIIECESIAFDKDGTLVESAPFWWGLFDSRSSIIQQTYGEETQIRYSEMNGVKEQNREIDIYGPLAIAPFNEEKVVLASAIYLTTNQAWTQCMNDAEAILIEADKLLPLEAYTSPMPGVPDVLHELSASDLQIAIVTSDHIDRTMRTIHHFHLEDTIDCIVCPHDVQNGKPAPDMVFRVSELMNLPPASIVVVGDSLNDMEMANAAGSVSVLIANKNYREPALISSADVIISSIGEITIRDK